MVYNQSQKTPVQKSLSPLSSLLLVDDDQRFLKGLRFFLNFYKTQNGQNLIVLGEAEREDQVLQIVSQHRPDLILLDLELKPRNKVGLNILHKLRRISHSSKVLVLSAYQEDEIVFQAMQAGAWGYVCKDSVAEQLLPAITTVLNNQIYLAPEITTSFFRSFKVQSGQYLTDCSQIKLTEREQEVLELLIEGASNQKISEQLYITVATVKAHLTSIFEKLNVSSRTQAIVKAFRLGLA